MRLEGKVAVITGAGSGFGMAASILFAREGARVVVAEILEERGNETVQTIRSSGGEAIFVHTDVAEEADAKRMISTAIETYGKLDILINNAGIFIQKRAEEMSEEEWNWLMGVNLKGIWLGCKYAIPEMKKAEKGVIINVASVIGLVGYGRAPAYSASKGGVVLLTKSLAMALGRYNIRVNAICPGVSETNLYRLSGITSQDIQHYFVSYVPLGRAGTPEEVAYGMLYLASDEASYVTGAILSIDGGLSAR